MGDLGGGRGADRALAGNDRRQLHPGPGGALGCDLDQADAEDLGETIGGLEADIASPAIHL